MKKAIIIQRRLLKNPLINLKEYGMIYCSRYEEYYKIVEKDESISKLYEVVLYPNAVEEGNLDYIQHKIKELS